MTSTTRSRSVHPDSALVGASRQEVGDVLSGLGTREEGLSEDQARVALDAHGPNVVSHTKPPSLLGTALRSFRNPFILLLIVLALIMAATQDHIGATTITVMVTISVVLDTSQQYKATRAASALQAMVVSTTTVCRGGQLREIPVPQVVPGDVIELKAGDLIPADLRVIRAKDLTLSQSSLTGESRPQDKTAHAQDTSPEDLLHSRNVCFMGTSVLSGSGLGVVVSTGRDTYFGAMAHAVESVEHRSAYDQAIRRVTFLLIRLMLVMAPIVFLLNWWHTGDWLQALLFAVAIGVGLTPSMLPTIISANLARGTSFMAGRKVIVKVPDAIQNIGSMDVLCTDKTGTLTEDRIVLERHLDIQAHPSTLALTVGYLNSLHSTGVRNTMDQAVIDAMTSLGKGNAPDLPSFRVVDEIPFDFERRRLSVVLDRVPTLDHLADAAEVRDVGPTQLRLEDGEDLLLTKGAVTEVLQVCDRVLVDGHIVALDDTQRATATVTAQRLNAQGMRVLAVSLRIVPADVARTRFVNDDWDYTPADETGMLLIGFLAFLDPPKESAGAAVTALRQADVDVKVVSGDSRLVCAHVVESLGLWGDTTPDQRAARSLTGREVDALDDHALAERAQDVLVFAEMSPLQKARVVGALQDRGHVVGHMGDGINDAPALRRADVGISVMDGVDIAKDTADIILLEQDLRVLHDGITEGRRTFGNIQKYLKITVASNFGNVFSVLIASVFIPFLPMLAVQLLVQNMLYDISQTSLPWARMDASFLARPRRWTDGHITRFMVVMGPVSTIFDVVAFLVMWNVFGATGVTSSGAPDPTSQHLFQTGWFLVGICTQVMVVHMVRTERIPFLQSRAAAPVMWATGAAIVVALVLPVLPVTATAFSFVAPPGAFYPWLVGIVLAYCLLTQAVKVLYIRRWKEWL
ncbi:MAG: magnesium-translocating P-type ATPase [Propionibacterium sp.]|nr:magnesium-translocating P-type ATPase [Propionibacterium sp.]